MGKILWLASYPKSGNTWIRLFLVNLLHGQGDAMDINRLGEATLAEPGTAGFALLDKRPWQTWLPREIAMLRPRVQEEIAKTGAGVVPVKTHSAFVRDHAIPAINMAVTMGAVYVVRNPLDIAVSYAHHQGMTVDEILTIMETSMFRTPTNGTNVHEVMGSWSEHVASWTSNPSPQLHVMRYEDMLGDAVVAFRELVGFMRIEASSDQIDQAVGHADFKTASALEKDHGFVEGTPAQVRFFRSGKSGQWRDVLSDAQVRRVVAKHRKQMARFDYIPQGF